MGLFVEKGFAATRVEEVAARAGVSKGTLFIYFPCKEELFKAVVRENAGRHLAEGMREVDGFTGTGAELTRLPTECNLRLKAGRCRFSNRPVGRLIQAINSWRNQSGMDADFCAGKLVHTVVAPPAAQMGPGLSAFSIVSQVSKLLRPRSLM